MTKNDDNNSDGESDQGSSSSAATSVAASSVATSSAMSIMAAGLKKSQAKKTPGRKPKADSVTSEGSGADPQLLEIRRNPQNCTVEILEGWMTESSEVGVPCPAPCQTPQLREEMEQLWDGAPGLERERVIFKIGAVMVGLRKKLKNATTVSQMVIQLQNDAGIPWVLRFYSCAQALRLREVQDSKDAIRRVNTTLTPLVSA